MIPSWEELHQEIALTLLLYKDIQKFAKLLCEYYYSKIPMFTSKNEFENNLLYILKESGMKFTVENKFKIGKGICNIFIESENKREVFILELNHSKTSEEGVKQIIDNNYAAKYISTRDVVYSISINYNQVTTTIDSFGYIINEKNHTEIEKYFKVYIPEEELLIKSIVTEVKLRKEDTDENLNQS